MMKQNTFSSFNFKGPVIQCNFLCNLQRNSTLGRCKIGKYMFSSQSANIFLTYQTFVTNLHLLRAELHCKMQEKLHRVTGPSRKILKQGARYRHFEKIFRASTTHLHRLLLTVEGKLTKSRIAGALRITLS